MTVSQIRARVRAVLQRCGCLQRVIEEIGAAIRVNIADSRRIRVTRALGLAATKLLNATDHLLRQKRKKVTS